jgi:hypothetical protein
MLDPEEVNLVAAVSGLLMMTSVLEVLLPTTDLSHLLVYIQFISILRAPEYSHIYETSFEMTSPARGPLFDEMQIAIHSVSQLNHQYCLTAT